MAILCGRLGNRILSHRLSMYSGGPRRAVLQIGSGSGHAGQENYLCLPADHGIGREHALVVETKNGPFFVLVDRGQGRTLVNGSPVTRLCVLHHLDEITLGGNVEGVAPLRLHFLQIQAVRLPARWTCPVCCCECDPGEIVLDCPGNHQRRYCFRCAVVKGLSCSCGYNFRLAVRRVLQSIDVRKRIQGSKVDRLLVRRVEPGSKLLDEKCALRTVSQEPPHALLQFRVGDEVLFCPTCNAAYHQGCWLSLRCCPRDGCGFPIQEVVEGAFLGEEYR